MGRKGSRLIPFVKQALLSKKYSNLRILDISCQIFVLDLPRKTLRLDKSCQHMLKDWYQLNGRNYNYDEDYSDAKQGMEAALRKSDFLLHIQSGLKKSLIYRILTDDEVKEKKLSKKALKKRPLKKNASSPASELVEGVNFVSSPGSSGYGSGLDDVPSPKPVESSNRLNISSDDRKNHFVLNTIRDHDYATVHCPLGQTNESNLPAKDILSGNLRNETGIVEIQDQLIEDLFPRNSSELDELINFLQGEFPEDLLDPENINNENEPPVQKEISSGNLQNEIGIMEILHQLIENDFPKTSLEVDELINNLLDEFPKDLDEFFTTANDNMSQCDVEPMQLHSSQDSAMDSQLSGNSAPTFLTFETQMFGSFSCLVEGQFHRVD